MDAGEHGTGLVRRNVDRLDVLERRQLEKLRLKTATSWITRSAPAPYLMTFSLKFVSPESTTDRPS